MKKHLLFVAFLICIMSLSYSQTNIPGGFVSGAWTLAGSPYLIQGEITIDTDASLTIEPGVEVLFAANCKFIVGQGATLTAIGTESDNILFDEYLTGNHWQGIRFMNASDASRLEYCHLTNGYATGGIHGGGIYCENSSPTIENCLIDYCGSDYWGGAIYCYNSNPIINESTIEENSSTWGGGGIFSNNSSPYITNCNIINNTGYTGAGIYCMGGNPTIIGNNISGNDANEHGGGIVCDNSTPLIEDNLISYNTSPGRGGGINLDNSAPPMNYNTIVYNSAYWGGGIYGYNGSSTIDRCTIAYNTAVYSGGGLDAVGTPHLIYNFTISNSILWQNSPSQISLGSNKNAFVNYTDIQGGWSGVGNIDADPLFVDPLNGDFHLQEGSPCIDAGDPSSQPDPDGTIADMGAFYFDYVPPQGLISGAVTPVLEGQTVYLLDDEYAFISSTSTLSDGSYSFPFLNAGEYKVALVEPFGYSTDQNNVDVVLDIDETEIVDFVLTACGEAPDILWTKCFDVRDEDYGASVQQTTDGGFVVTGMAGYGGDTEMVLLKLDADGIQEWDPIIGPNTVHGSYVQQTTDGGYIVVGHTHDYGNLGQVYLRKFDSIGNDMWLSPKNFGYSYDDDAWCVQQTSDGGYIMTGWCQIQWNECQVYLVKTFADGELDWSNNFGESQEDRGWSVRQTSDGGYIIAGRTASYGSGGWDIYLLKTFSDGNLDWQTTFGGTGTDESQHLEVCSDGGYIISGYANAYPPDNNAVIYIIKTDSGGEIEWTKYIGGAQDDRAGGIRETPDGGFIIAANTNSEGEGQTDMCAIKLDSQGNQEWTKLLGGPEIDWVRDVALVSDGGYIFTGKTESFGAGDGDLWLVRLGEPSNSTITGTVNPNFSNLTVDLYDDEGELLDTRLTDENGIYTFDELAADNYTVELIVPLGYEVDQNNVPVNLEAGATEIVDFTLTPIVITNDARATGYWRHQVNANITGKGNIDYSITELLSLSTNIFEHYFQNQINPIEVLNVTYVGSPATSLDMDDLQYMLNINKGGCSMYEKACQHYLALLLNIASEKVGQMTQASEDGATHSQAVVYINEILGVNDELARDISETLNNAQLVAAGVIPPTTPNVIFGDGDIEGIAQPLTFRFEHPSPNPFNPETKLRFSIPETGKATLKVYDIQGREIAELMNELKPAGIYEITFDGSGLSSGIYFVRLTSDGGKSMVRKVVLMK